MKVFLSYQAQADEPFARKLGASLQEAGITATSINLRLQYAEKMPRDIEALAQIVWDCSHIIPLLSRQYVGDRWLQVELNSFNSVEMLKKKSDLIIPAIIGECEPPPILDERIASGTYVDFTKREFKDGVGELIKLFMAAGLKRAFVIMKYGNDALDRAYREAMVPVLGRFGYTAVRADQRAKQGEITAQIYDHIGGSELVLSDLTCRSPNCYFETGYAYAMKKPVILSARKGTKLPFNLSTHHVLFWTSPEDLAAQMTSYIEKNLAEKMQPAAPTAAQ
jgi:nucleoside 2-deoxyribosyltransferase